MKTITTLTMSPVIDKSSAVDIVVSEDKLRCRIPAFESGGGGINVSRAIKKLGGESLAIYPCGGRMGAFFQELLEQDSITHHPIAIDADLRENFTVLEESTTKQFRFGMPGAKLSETEWRSCIDAIVSLTPKPDYLVLSGSLPVNVPDDFYGQLIHQLQKNKCDTKIIVDASGRSLLHAVDAGVYMIKPNLRELRKLVGKNLEDESSQVEMVQGLISKGKIQLALISLGAGGALLVTEKEYKHFRTPTVPIVSKVGAGDTMVAGVTLALARGMPLDDAVRYGIASAAATVMTPGTELCRLEDAERLFKQLKNEIVACH